MWRVAMGCSPAGWARITGRTPGRRGDPRGWRVHRAAGADHYRLSARHHHGDAVLHAGDRRRVRSARAGCAHLQPAPGHFRRGALGEGMRDELEQRLGLYATNIYGLSEVMGPGVAEECAGERDGMTIWEDHFYPEIIDPGSGLPVLDGELGELVITTLTREAMPVIRYRTRDLTRLLPGAGRTMRP